MEIEIEKKKHKTSSLTLTGLKWGLRLGIACLIVIGVTWGSYRLVDLSESLKDFFEVKRAQATQEIADLLGIEERTVTRYVPATELDLDRIVELVAKEYGVPAVLLRALHIQESGAGLRTDRVRYEPHLLKRFKREKWMTEAEHQALASSWGLGQIIYGIWKKPCGLKSYADLLNPVVNVRCSALILSDCLARRAKVRGKAERVRQCLGEYNGDRSGGYAEQVMRHLTELVFEEEL